ncbi:MAG: hypothetical protein GX610_23190 [Rhodococcus sp.]|nr:hypothetical protein [Rhodococcus sp. (in: high G+C Gram-positive bacteria)]
MNWIPTSRRATTSTPSSTGSWIAETEIPADEAGYGIFTQLQDKSLDTQRGIAESAADDLGNGDADSDRAKIGALYQSAMDEKAIDEVGYAPLIPELEEVDSIESTQDVVRFVHEDAVDGGAILFSLASGADFQDASKHIGFVHPTGIALPSKDYYSDPQYAEILDAYRNYLRKSLELVGIGPEQAAVQADEANAVTPSRVIIAPRGRLVT